MPAPVHVVATLYFWLLFLTTAPLFTVVGVGVWLCTAPFDPGRAVLHRLVCAGCHGYLRAWPGWSVRVEGRERLPPGAAVLVANHQSVADVFAAMGLAHPFKFVSKASLFRVPLLGWMMHLLRYVPLERGRPQSTRGMLEACRGWLRRGVAVLLFPEGTYGPGDDFLPFKRGPFRLAVEERVPVVPVLLEGTHALVEGDGPFLRARARIRVRVLPPIPPEDFGEDDGALAARVRALLLAERGRG
jgi:1-acyl-sn-glycerol-3-phosphate acyltransferase